MAVVIDISSDSEPEESPNKAARSALQGFLPRKQKIGIDGGNGSNGTSVKQQRKESVPKPSKAIVEPEKRKISDQKGHEQRHSVGASTRKDTARENDPAGTSTTQHIAAHLTRDHSFGLGHGPGLVPRRETAPERRAPRPDPPDRVRKFNDFYEKEALRRKSAQGAPAKCSLPTANVAADLRETRESRFPDSASVSKHAGRSRPNAPVLSGAGLNIVKLPSYSEDEVANGIRQAKRLASAANLAGLTAHPPKRPRTIEPSRPPELLPPEQQVQHDRVPDDIKHLAQESAHQLETELAASLPLTSPQKSKHSPRGVAHVLANHATISTPPVASQHSATSASSHGTPFTPADDALLAKLKEVDRLSWDEIHAHFAGRSRASLQVRYSTRVKGRSLGTGPRPSNTSVPIQLRRSLKLPVTARQPESADADRGYEAPTRRKKRGGGPSAVDGFVSWSQVKDMIDDLEPHTTEDAADSAPAIESGPLACQDRAYPASLSRLLRQRELGSNGRRGWVGSPRGASDEIKNHVLDDYQLKKHFMNTCGDVTCLAYASNGERFAAGSIAVSDDRSMQYNSGLNLLLGNSETSMLQELPQHHVSRPAIDPGTGNVNGIHAMRESQDPRLFMTVAAVAFSPNNKRLYSAGSDKKVRMYRVVGDIHNAKCRYEIDHPAPVDLLSVNNHGLLATACHFSGDGSVRVYDCHRKHYNLKLSLSPSRADSQSALPLFPSALKWGSAPQHTKFLLAGFSSDSTDEARDTAGETALWDVETGRRMPLSTVTRNVFDVAWNPLASAASTAFAVASTVGSGKSLRDTQSIVQLYAPKQGGACQVLEWECPAFDINDVLYCPYDENLIAAGATDGRVYVWDTRFANRNQKPLHVMAHGDSVTILDRRLDREVADTGIRFLSWGATGSRLYSGSSDGVLKAWNPYRSPGNTFIKDAATFETAIMSGAFSPDHRDLLIGEDRGRINVLSVSCEGKQDTLDDMCGASKKFKLHPAPAPPRSTASPFAAAHELLQSRQIVLRPAGALPIRQAVQGPNYSGPYLLPSHNDSKQAEDVYERALVAQNEAHCEKGVPSSQASAAETAAVHADNGVRTAQAALERLASREDEFTKLEPLAVANQLALRAAGQARIQLEAALSHAPEHCKLDCNFLPKDEDNMTGMPDSHRSEQRIPSALRALPRRRVDVTELDCKGLYTAGLAGPCMHCSTPAPSPAFGMHLKMLCNQRCASIRACFASTCEWCSAPVRGGEGTTAAKLCERCAFACFRCSQPVNLLPGGSLDDSILYCERCELAWTSGILGYELVSDVGSKARSPKRKVARNSQSSVSDDVELLHYHARWET